MAKCPGIIMQVANNKLLSRRLHWEVLKQIEKKIEDLYLYPLLIFWDRPDIYVIKVHLPTTTSEVLSLNSRSLEAYQLRKKLFCCPTWHWKSTVCACITSSKSFAEKITWMFIGLETKIWYREDIFFLIYRSVSLKSAAEFSRVKCWSHRLRLLRHTIYNPLDQICLKY